MKAHSNTNSSTAPVCNEKDFFGHSAIEQLLRSYVTDIKDRANFDYSSDEAYNEFVLYTQHTESKLWGLWDYFIAVDDYDTAQTCSRVMDTIKTIKAEITEKYMNA